ncbi:MAG: cupredoxin domain-containing protein [Candidatus Magasanikbacteria bacterium]
MDNQQWAILVAVAVIVLGVVVYLGGQGNKVKNNQPTANGEQTAAETESQNETPESPDDASAVNNDDEVSEPSATGTQAEDVDNPSAPPESEKAPEQSDPVEESEVSSEAVKIGVSSSGYNPSEFTVSSGNKIKLAITSEDDQTHIFKFRDKALKSVSVGLGPGVTRTVNFQAPATGEYEYYCDVPGHAGRGETGTMIVQ